MLHCLCLFAEKEKGREREMYTYEHMGVVAWSHAVAVIS